jgi:hypothetical protein
VEIIQSDVSTHRGSPRSKDQSGHRRYAQFRDQHDRPWEGNIELATGDPVGGLNLKVPAPFVPDQRFIQRVPGDPYGLFIDYDAMLAEREAAWALWDRALREFTRQHFGTKAGEVLKEYDETGFCPPEIFDLTGPTPLPVEPVQAAMAGDEWVLFGKGKMPESARPFFDVPEKAPAPRRGRKAKPVNPFAQASP